MKHPYPQTPVSRRAFLEWAAGWGAVTTGVVGVCGAEPAAAKPRIVSVVVEQKLAKVLEQELDRYGVDLAAEGMKARLDVVAANSPPAEIRTLLADTKKASQDRLVGALLVGNVPSARANRNAIARAAGMSGVAAPSEYWHAHPCDAYYMNLRGSWKDTDGDGILDLWEGERQPDLWVSRLRPDTVVKALGMSEVELMRRYFAKNHAYRRGRLALPPRRALVAWYTMDALRTQKEGGWGCSPELIYGDQVAVFGGMSEGEQAARGYQRLMTDVDGFELGVINCVTFWDRHNFEKGGEFPWDWVKAAKPKRVVWYHMLTSEPGRHDQENYLAGIYLFSDTPTQVLYCGSQHSGVVAAPTLYPDLAGGETFGEAFRRAFQYETDRWGQPHFYYVNWGKPPEFRVQTAWGASLPATVLHGDGTLRLPPWRPKSKG